MTTHNDLVNYNLDPSLKYSTAPQLFTVTALQRPSGASRRFSLTKASSLKTLNSIAKSIKSKFSLQKTTPKQGFSRSVECILTNSDQDLYRHSSQERSVSDEEQENMAMLRRVESDRRGSIPSRLVSESIISMDKGAQMEYSMGSPPFLPDWTKAEIW